MCCLCCFETAENVLFGGRGWRRAFFRRAFGRGAGRKRGECGDRRGAGEGERERASGKGLVGHEGISCGDCAGIGGYFTQKSTEHWAENREFLIQSIVWCHNPTGH